MALFIILVTIGYLMGSISSAVIVCRLFSFPDPRLEGSQNPGATNVLRLAGKQYAALVLLFDILKGLIPVLIAHYLTLHEATIAFTALAAVIGHIYPVFFGFKGGKGVATAIGALLGFQLIVGTLVALTWLVVAKLSRYSSLASLVSIGLAPFYTLLLVPELDVFPPIFFIALLIVFKHKDNITRLIDGVEPKIHLSKSNIIEQVVEPVPPVEIEELDVEESPLIEEEVVVKKTRVTKPKTVAATKAKVTVAKTKKVSSKDSDSVKKEKTVKPKTTAKTVKAAKPKAKKSDDAEKKPKAAPKKPATKKAAAKPKVKKAKEE